MEDEVLEMLSRDWDEAEYEAEAELKKNEEESVTEDQNLKIWFGMSKNRNI